MMHILLLCILSIYNVTPFTDNLVLVNCVLFIDFNVYVLITYLFVYEKDTEYCVCLKYTIVF